jgi:Lar family restriction alleviation protein
MPNEITITPTTLAELDALAASATPGPCPFCGGKNVQLGATEMERHPQSFYIWCRDCQFDGPYDLGISGAIAAWNTRPAYPALSAALKSAWAENEKLKAALIDLRHTTQRISLTKE